MVMYVKMEDAGELKSCAEWAKHIPFRELPLTMIEPL